MNFKITHQNKIYFFLALAFYSVFGYLSINHFPLFPPQPLPFTIVDHYVPLIPDTIWIYASMYPMMIVAFTLIQHEIEVLEKGMKSFFFLQTIAFVIFIFYPVLYPRENFPLNMEMTTFTRFIFESIRSADQPLNCFPSLHVANCFICAMFVWNVNRSRAVPFLVWSCVISFSTLSTKQHYFYDVVLGFSLALACYWIIFKKNLRPVSLSH